MSKLSEAVDEINQSTDWTGMQRAGLAVAPSVLPTAMAGGLTPFLGPWAGPVVGGVAGEAANNLIGLTKPSVYSYAAQAAVPPGMKGTAALKRVGSAFGEKSGAETLNRLGAPEIKALLDKYLPPTASDTLFKMLVGHQANIPVSPYLQSIQKVKKDVALSSPGYQGVYGGLKKNIQGTEQDITYDTLTHEPVLPIQKFQREMHDVGKHTQERDSLVRGEYKQLYGGLAGSLEQASLPGTPGAILKEAREAFKREKVLEEIGELARPFTMSGQGEMERFRANIIINRLKDPKDDLTKFYRQSFTPEEQKDLMSHLVTLNKIPPFPAPRGSDAGSKALVGTISSVVGGGGAGALAGSAAGMGAEGAALGVGAGYVIPKVATMIHNYNIANNTIMGKKLIAELWRGNGGKFSPEFWSALEGFAAAQAAHPELFQMAGEAMGSRRKQ